LTAVSVFPLIILAETIFASNGVFSLQGGQFSDVLQLLSQLQGIVQLDETVFPQPPFDVTVHALSRACSCNAAKIAFQCAARAIFAVQLGFCAKKRAKHLAFQVGLYSNFLNSTS